MNYSTPYYTYAEDLFVINYIFDWCILFFAQKIVCGQYSFKNTSFGALLGSIYSLLVILDKEAFFNEPMKFFICFIMILFTLRGRGEKASRYLLITFVMYMESFLFSGAVEFILNNCIFIYANNFNMEWVIVFLGIVISLFFYLLLTGYKNRVRTSENMYDVELFYKEKSLCTRVFLDSGNMISKILNKYVIFLDKSIIKLLIYDMNIFDFNSYDEMLGNIKEQADNYGIFFIKVNTISDAHLELAVFPLKKVKIFMKNNKVIHREAVAVMSYKNINIFGCHGLINGNILFD